LIGGEPVAQPYADPANTFDATDARSKLWAEQSRVGGLIGNPSDRCRTEVDRGWCGYSLLEVDPVSQHDCSIECEPRFGTVPIDKFSDGMLVSSLPTFRSQAVNDCRLGLFEIWSARTRLGDFLLRRGLGILGCLLCRCSSECSRSSTLGRHTRSIRGRGSHQRFARYWTKWHQRPTLPPLPHQFNRSSNVGESEAPAKWPTRMLLGCWPFLRPRPDLVKGDVGPTSLYCSRPYCQSPAGLETSPNCKIGSFSSLALTISSGAKDRS